jgi:hypothetical protein
VRCPGFHDQLQGSDDRFLSATIKSGLQRNLIERELYLRASGLDYTIVRAPILTSAPVGQTYVRITQAVNRLTAGPKISRGDLARVMILASEQAVASRKTFDLFAEKGAAPSDQQILNQLEQIPTDRGEGVTKSHV